MPEIIINVSDEDFALLQETASNRGESVQSFFKRKLLAEINSETDGLIVIDRLENLVLGQRLLAAKMEESFKELAYDHELQKAKNAPVLTTVTSRASGVWASAINAVQDYLIGNGVDPLGLDDI